MSRHRAAADCKDGRPPACRSAGRRLGLVQDRPAPASRWAATEHLLPVAHAWQHMRRSPLARSAAQQRHPAQKRSEGGSRSVFTPRNLTACRNQRQSADAMTGGAACQSTIQLRGQQPVQQPAAHLAHEELVHTLCHRLQREGKLGERRHQDECCGRQLEGPGSEIEGHLLQRLGAILAVTSSPYSAGRCSA